MFFACPNTKMILLAYTYKVIAQRNLRRLHTIMLYAWAKKWHEYLLLRVQANDVLCVFFVHRSHCGNGID